MNEFTNDEITSCASTMQAPARPPSRPLQLQDDETELREMTDGALAKLERMSDADWDGIDLYPDF